MDEKHQRKEPGRVRWMKERRAEEKQPNELWWDASVEEVIKSPGISQDSSACTYKCFQRTLSNDIIHLPPCSYLLLVFTSVSLHSPLLSLLFNSSLSIPLHLVSLFHFSFCFLHLPFIFSLSSLSLSVLPRPLPISVCPSPPPLQSPSVALVRVA